jgi:hypothetical protein
MEASARANPPGCPFFLLLSLNAGVELASRIVAETLSPCLSSAACHSSNKQPPIFAKRYGPVDGRRECPECADWRRN